MQSENKLTIPTFDPSQQLAVGIQEYIEEGKQIPAITKYMLTDFIVNEIDVNGKVVVIENKPLSIKNVRQEKKPPNYIMTKQLLSQIELNLSKQCATQLESLYQKLQSGQKIYTWEFIMQDVSKQKSQRLKIHNFVRQKLQNIQSNTLDNNKIRLKFNPKLKKVNPLTRHKYIHFKLFKSNIDTMSAIFKLSKITGISQKIFSTAGLKDKRGVTTQLVSVWNSDLKNLKRFYEVADRNREMWIDGFEEMKQDAISMGCLFGNQFGLVLRLLRAEDAQEIHHRVEAIKQYGIINYFGMQRFGSCATRTHLIGVKIIKKQWKQLVEELLLEDTGIDSLNKLKRECYEQKQFNKGDRALSNKYKIEKSLFQGLQRYGQNYYNVFENLPRSMKTLYCHALQSYLWNKITSRRLRQHGKKLVIGDLVGVKKAGKNQLTQQNKNINEQKIEQQKLAQKTQQPQVTEQDQAQEQIDEEELEIILINEQNINQYSFTDLIAPLYGVSINLPEESLMNKYLEAELMKLDLHKDDFQDKSKSLCFKGAYRKCIIKPPMIEFEILTHKQKKAEILSPFYMKDEKMQYEEGELRSAKIVLQLPKSSYATIAIREILHIPSSFKVQTQLNGLYEKV